jgi:ribosomal protein S4
VSINYFEDRLDLIDNIVLFKQRTGFLKKDFKKNNTILYRLYPIKFNFNKQNFNFKDDEDNSNNMEITTFKNQINNLYFNNFLNLKRINSQEKDSFFYKSLDMRHKTYFLFYKNRNILRTLLNRKLKRQYKFSKFIKNLIKQSAFDFFHIFEYKLVNILVKSNFFFNHRDAEFFIKNNYVLLNGSVISNPNYVLKLHEIVSISFDKYYYLFYRKSLNDSLSNLNRFNPRV